MTCSYAEDDDLITTIAELREVLNKNMKSIPGEDFRYQAVFNERGVLLMVGVKIHPVILSEPLMRGTIKEIRGVTGLNYIHFKKSR
jgi:hypothetical protein